MRRDAHRKEATALAGLALCAVLLLGAALSGCRDAASREVVTTTTGVTAAEPDTTTTTTTKAAGKKKESKKQPQQSASGQQPRQGSGQEQSFTAFPNALAFPGTIILGRPTETAVTFSLVADADSEAYVEYGYAPGGYGEESARWTLRAGTPLEADLTGLRADSAVFYRLHYKTSGAAEYSSTPELSFHTARAAGSAFTFAVEADPHIELDAKMQPALFVAALQDMATMRPDFLIDLGDTFLGEKLAAPSLERLEALYAHDRRYFGIVAASAPLYLVNGNHDAEWGWPASTVAGLESWTVEARTLFYPNPFPGDFYTGDSEQTANAGYREDYYAWEWGDALFVALDLYSHCTVDPKSSGDLWDYTLGTDQYLWLEKTLRTSTAAHKFVFAHHILGDVRGGVEWAGLYEWGGYGKSGAYEFAQERPGWDTPIHRLFVETGVDIFFQGHDHFFVKQETDGVIYQEVPQPATPTGDPQNQAHEYAYKSGEVLGSPGYLLVTVDASTVRVDFRQEGRTVYTYSIR